jgi:hypothetical protein
MTEEFMIFLQAVLFSFVAQAQPLAAAPTFKCHQLPQQRVACAANVSASCTQLANVAQSEFTTLFEGNLDSAVLKAAQDRRLTSDQTLNTRACVQYVDIDSGPKPCEVFGAEMTITTQVFENIRTLKSLIVTECKTVTTH